MSDSMSAPVDESTRKLVEASTRSRSGRLRNPSIDDPSSLPGLRRRDARELIGDRRGRHRLPRGERAADGGLEIGGGHAGDAAVGDEVADRRLRPLQRDLLSAHRARRTSDTRTPGRTVRASARPRPTSATGRFTSHLPPASRTVCSKSPSGSAPARRIAAHDAHGARGRRRQQHRRGDEPAGVVGGAGRRGTRPGSGRARTARSARARRETRRRADRRRTPARRRRCCGSGRARRPARGNAASIRATPFR